jgi:Ca-activated chloride channel family protein
LATNYTSFVAVDESVINKGGALKTVKQPLPMPQNVNNSAVGAAAEVQEKTRYKVSYKVMYEEGLIKSDKRKVTMGFKAIYSKLILRLLKKYDGIRISFNAKGKIISVEKCENGKWTFDETMLKEFQAFSNKTIQIDKKMTLTLKK